MIGIDCIWSIMFNYGSIFLLYVNLGENIWTAINQLIVGSENSRPELHQTRTSQLMIFIVCKLGFWCTDHIQRYIREKTSHVNIIPNSHFAPSPGHLLFRVILHSFSVITIVVTRFLHFW